MTGNDTLRYDAPVREYASHPLRGRFNAGFFTVLDGYINWLVRSRKARIFSDLPAEVVEVGPGVGANLRYLSAGTRLVGIEPNPMMYAGLRWRAARYGVELDIRTVIGESIDLPNRSADMVISSLLLCTVTEPDRVVSEIRRILRPGGRYAFLEHVAAPEGSMLRTLQRRIRRPWGWLFEGCSCERDLASVIDAAGFSSVELEHYDLRSPFLPVNPQITGVATA